PRSRSCDPQASTPRTGSPAHLVFRVPESSLGVSLSLQRTNDFRYVRHPPCFGEGSHSVQASLIEGGIVLQRLQRPFQYLGEDRFLNGGLLCLSLAGGH